MGYFCFEDGLTYCSQVKTLQIKQNNFSFDLPFFRFDSLSYSLCTFLTLSQISTFLLEVPLEGSLTGPTVLSLVVLNLESLTIYKQ